MKESGNSGIWLKILCPEQGDLMGFLQNSHVFPVSEIPRPKNKTTRGVTSGGFIILLLNGLGPFSLRRSSKRPSLTDLATF